MHPIDPELPVQHMWPAHVCVLRASHALVQATVGVGTVIIVYIGVAYTGGGVGRVVVWRGAEETAAGAAKEWLPAPMHKVARSLSRSTTAPPSHPPLRESRMRSASCSISQNLTSWPPPCDATCLTPAPDTSAPVHARARATGRRLPRAGAAVWFIGAVPVRSALEPDTQGLGPVPRRDGRADLQSLPVWDPVPSQPNPPPPPSPCPSTGLVCAARAARQSLMALGEHGVRSGSCGSLQKA